MNLNSASLSCGVYFTKIDLIYSTYLNLDSTSLSCGVFLARQVASYMPLQGHSRIEHDVASFFFKLSFQIFSEEDPARADLVIFGIAVFCFQNVLAQIPKNHFIHNFISRFLQIFVPYLRFLTTRENSLSRNLVTIVTSDLLTQYYLCNNHMTGITRWNVSSIEYLFAYKI